MNAPATPQGTQRIAFLNSLRGRLIIVLTLFAGLTALVLSVNDYRYVRGMLKDSVEQQLKLRTAGLRAVLLAYVDQQQERVLLVASRTRLRALLRERLDHEVGEELFLAQTALILQDARASTESFRNILIADVNGRVITATDPASVGQSIADEPAFVLGRDGPSFGLPQPSAAGFHTLLSAPAHTNDGRLLGVVLVDLDAARMRGQLATIPSRFASAEVRVAALHDGQIRYLFPVGDDAAAMQVSVATDPAMDSALSGSSGFEAIDDYQGRDVLVAYQAVGYGGWGLVTQVDADEAYAPIKTLSSVVAAAGIVVAVLGLIVGIRVAATLTGPILELTRVAAEFGTGDLSARASVRGRDEISLTAQAFNAMAESLQRHQTRLEELVRQRTVVLQERTEQLQRSHSQLEELCRMLEDQAEVTERDLNRAELIQRSLLPHEPPALTDFRVESLYRPGRNIGGDLYDVIKVGERFVVLVVADASGHGVSAAMLAVLFKHRLRVVNDRTGEPYLPGAALVQLNASLVEDIMAPGVFYTCAYCLLDTVTRRLIIASAGHPPLLWLRHDGEVEQVEHTGPALGLYEQAEFAERTIELHNHDRVLLYTDGLFDVDGSPDVATIVGTLRTVTSQSRVLEQVLVAVSGGREREDRDDVTMLLLTAEPGESNFYDRKDGVVLNVESDEHEAEITLGEDDVCSFICISGRVTWTHGEALLTAAEKLFADNRPLIVDLSQCEYLDSTMLGTLHEVVQRADAVGASVRLQGARLALAEAFKELSMDTVLSHMGSWREPLPAERRPLEMPQTDLRRQRSRLLQAHEELAALSDANMDQFGAVLEALRSEVDTDTR